MRDNSSTPVISVPAEAAGERFDRFLSTCLGSRAAAERAIEQGALLDGRARVKSYRLEGGERIELAAPVEVPAAPPTGPDPVIVWRDEHLAVIDKPAGLVVHPGAGRPAGTLVDALSDILAGGPPGRPGIVHRLDRDTSGLMVVACSEEAFDLLSVLVRRRALERTYLALVRGRPGSRSGRIEAPIGRDRTDPTRISLATDSPREAITHFEIAEALDHDTLLTVRLETGRMHQIRVHLAAIGLPVLGDTVYGVRDPALGRQFLHSARLSFPHPISGEPLAFDAPLPPDLQRYLDSLS